MKIPFLFGIHCHQPQENFYHVVDNAVEISYSPFLEVALKHKGFKFAVHYSGWLLDYIKTNHKPVFKNLQKLSDNGQIEFFTGGYYEPILSAIHSDDRKGQVLMLSNYIKDNFGQFPKSLWLTERVWDPAIITDLNDVGIEDVVVDDYHLIASGIDKSKIKGYYTTEQDGNKINLFPIDKTLRYLTPFKDEKMVHNYLAKRRGDGTKLITCFDDGEKFGLWPTTHDWVYKKGWLDRFINIITASSDVEFMHYHEAKKIIKPEGLAYLPITSYVEMGEWVLTPQLSEKHEEAKCILKSHNFDNILDSILSGGIWKQFFVKYSESNELHKRTLSLSKKSKSFKNDKKFLDYLYRSECNDSLWHGIFGGLYLPNLRNNAWAALINAQSVYEKLAKIKLGTIEAEDINFDGYDEAYYIGKNINYQFNSRENGELKTIEIKDKAFNLSNVISRRKESYHTKYTPISKKELDERNSSSYARTIHDESHYIDSETFSHITYDWYNKNSFIDHFVFDFSLDSFTGCNFTEVSSFINTPADTSIDKNNIKFVNHGKLTTFCGSNDITLNKTFSISDDKINFEIKAKSNIAFKCDYVSELNLHFANIEKVTINNLPLSGNKIIRSKVFEIIDLYLNKKIVLKYNSDVDLYFFTILTVSQSELGVDLTAQGVSFGAKIPFDTELSLKGSFEVTDNE